MRSVYTSSRSAADTVAALCHVFGAGGPVREQLSFHAEMAVEPVGWDALWKLSKEFCKKFEVRFPCVANVSVTSVDYEALTACVDVYSVQHESMTLPEWVQDVPLVDLWPTVKQREECVNAAATAEFIDLMRFYYNNLWMPWDEQDDKVLLPSTIEERMALWTDIQNGTIPKTMAREITLLRDSATDAHERLKVLESSLCEDDYNNDDDAEEGVLPPNYIALCAELTCKLEGHQAKWMLYEQALVRQHFLAREKAKWQKSKNQRNVVALWQGGGPAEFSQMSAALQARLRSHHTLVVTPSAEQAFALDPEELVVCSPRYEVPEIPMHQLIISSFNGATLTSSDTRSCLLKLSEECALRNLTLLSAKVNTVVVASTCATHIQNCKLLDESQSSQQSDFAQGLVAMTDSVVRIEDTTFENFYSGIVVHKGAQVELKNCTIRKCGVGIQMYSGARVTLTNTVIAQCAEQCIRIELANVHGNATSTEGLHIAANCTIGSGDLQKEVLVVRQDVDLM